MLGGWDYKGIAGIALASHPLGEVHMNLLMLHGRDCLHGLHEDSHLAGKVANNPSGFGDTRNWKMVVFELKLVNA